MCVCVCKNECICNTLEHPPTVTLSPSTVDILSSTAKDPSKIPESVARCHGHHEWHKRMSWASAYPNDNPSGESDAWLPVWWIFFCPSFFSRQKWLNDVFSFFFKVPPKQVFFLGPRPQRENEMNSGQYDMLTLEIDWGSRILTEAWGLLFWRNKAVEFFPKKQGQMTLQLHRIWIYTVIDFFLTTTRLLRFCWLSDSSFTFTYHWVSEEKPQSQLRNCDLDRKKATRFPKKWIVPSLPNTSWEGVLGMFLGPKHVLARCLEA